MCPWQKYGDVFSSSSPRPTIGVGGVKAESTSVGALKHYWLGHVGTLSRQKWPQNRKYRRLIIKRGFRAVCLKTFIYKGKQMKLGSVCRGDQMQSNGPILRCLASFTWVWAVLYFKKNTFDYLQHDCGVFFPGTLHTVREKQRHDFNQKHDLVPNIP